jgi:hypothetical protein
VRFTEFDLTTFDDGETIEDYTLRLSGMAPEQQDGEIVMKMIRSMSPRFKQITIVIKTLLNVSTMSATNLIGRLKEAEEVFEEAPTSLQQYGKLYLTEEEWDARRKKREAVAQAKAVSAGCGRGGSSSSGSSSKPTGDECRRCGKMGHWACECRLKPKKEQVHIAQDEEEASLMLTSATLIHPEVI